MSRNLYTRDGVWWARFKVRGVEYRRSLRTRSKSLAERRLSAVRQQIENEALFGIHGPLGWPSAVMQWGDPNHCPVQGRTKARYATSLTMVRQHLDHLSVQEIDAGVIRELVKARQRGGASNATIRRDLTAVASVLDYAVGEGLIASNAARAHSRRTIPERREPIALPDHDSIWAVIGPRRTRFGDMILFAWETGMRQEEIAALIHREVEWPLSAAVIIGKRRRRRAVPLSPLAMAIIDRQPRHLKCDYVFWHMVEGEDGRPAPDRYRNVSSNFGDYLDRAVARARKAAAAGEQAAQKAAQVTPFRFHDLRHLFAVEYLRERRGNIYDLQRILGHSSIKTTEIYLDFLTPEEARAAMFGVAQNGEQERRFARE